MLSFTFPLDSLFDKQLSGVSQHCSSCLKFELPTCAPLLSPLVHVSVCLPVIQCLHASCCCVCFHIFPTIALTTHTPICVCACACVDQPSSLRVVGHALLCGVHASRPPPFSTYNVRILGPNCVPFLRGICVHCACACVHSIVSVLGGLAPRNPVANQSINQATNRSIPAIAATAQQCSVHLPSPTHITRQSTMFPLPIIVRRCVLRSVSLCSPAALSLVFVDGVASCGVVWCAAVCSVFFSFLVFLVSL